jgi:hypothetical protein
MNFPTCRIPRFLDIFGQDLFLVNKLLTEKDPNWNSKLDTFMQRGLSRHNVHLAA